MTRESLRAGGITSDTLTTALLQARGDLFLAAQLLGCTAREIDGYVRASDDLRAFVQAISQVKASDDYERLSAEQFEQELQRKVARHRVEAQDIIADLAHMPLGEGGVVSAAMAEVKLKAAIALRGTTDTRSTSDSGQATALAELNRLYAEAAPRIRSVRAVQIEYEP